VTLFTCPVVIVHAFSSIIIDVSSHSRDSAIEVYQPSFNTMLATKSLTMLYSHTHDVQLQVNNIHYIFVKWMTHENWINFTIFISTM